jgi:hypothetical protein
VLDTYINITAGKQVKLASFPEKKGVWHSFEGVEKYEADEIVSPLDIFLVI